MAHNAHRINNQGPNVAGDMTLDIGDLNDVSAAGAATGQGLAYNSATGMWTPAALPTNEYIYLGVSAALASTETHGMAFTAGSVVYFQAVTALNTIAGATLTKAAGKNVWYSTITLPAGKYSIISNAYCLFSSTGHYATRWKRTDTSEAITNTGVIGADLATYPAAPGSMLGVFELETSASINCVVETVAGAAASTSQTSFIAPSNFVLIRRLS